MKKKNFTYWKAVIAAAGLLFAAAFFLKEAQVRTYDYSEEYVMTNELPKLLSAFYFSEEEWEQKIKEEKLNPVLTNKEINWILEQTGTKEYLSYQAKKKNKAFSRTEWNQIYDGLLDLSDKEQEVSVAEELVLKKKDETIVCGGGEYVCDTKYAFLEPMQTVSFYIKNGEIIGIRSLSVKQAVVPNVYITKADETAFSFLFGGETYTIPFAAEKQEKIENHVCDLVWSDGNLETIQMKEDTIQGDLLAVNDSYIEIEGYGEIKRSKNMPIYQTYDIIEEKQLSDIVIANMRVEYVVAKDSVEAILLSEPAKISRIRVLLLNEANGIFRNDIQISGSGAYEIVGKTEKKTRAANETVTASEIFANTKENRVQLRPTEENGELFLTNENGAKSNGYGGIFELCRYKEGYTVVNELPIEEYLCAVVPSEMPVSYEAEALKAQAVCARSYAYIQLARGDYAEYGAHVDDSTNYQVYNKQEKNEKTSSAVRETSGEVLTYQGETAEAYYFSTSAGVTENGEGWNIDKNPSYAYLCSRQIKEAQAENELDLSSEEAFSSFLTKAGAEYYESDLPYFRWKADVSFAETETQNKIKQILKVRKEKSPAEILFIDASGNEQETMKGFGSLTGAGVGKRSKSGLITEFIFQYENGAVKVLNEYSIRTALGAGCGSLTLADGTVKTDRNVLPSAFFQMTKNENGTYVLIGGGYGHGIGMSQNGAQKMAQAGKSWREILKFFFQGIEIKK